MTENKIVLAPVPRKAVFKEACLKTPKGLEKALEAHVLGSRKLPGTVFRSDSGLPVANPEGYRLSIGKGGITVAADAPAGAFYAAMTLRQIVRQCPKGELPCLEIHDWPDFKARGVMLDISRDKVPTMATLFRLVDLLAEFKLNQFQLYTEHTFAYAEHKTVWKDASPMTAAEIRELDTHCAQRGIELVPNQNSFGHMERWLRHDAYRHLAEAPDGWTSIWGERRNYAFSLTPADPGSLRLVESLYDELLPNFKSRMLNVGCDETFDLGQGRSKALCDQRGTGHVYFDFLMQIHRLVKERGHTMQFWGDIILRHPELIPDLPKDLIALNWGYEANHPFDKECRAFACAGVPFYVCPGTSAWNTVGGRWENARANLLNAAENGLKHGAIGFLNTEWGDNGHFQQLPIAYPGFVYGAVLSWAVEQNRNLDIEAVLSCHLFADTTGRLARALILLGNAYLKTGVFPPNNTILSHLLLEPEYLKVSPKASRLIEKLRPANLTAAATEIRVAVKSLAQARPRARDAAFLKGEMDLAASMMAFACRLGVARAKAKGGKAAAIPGSERIKLAKELGGLIVGYKKIWLKRNRSGGLKESVSRLNTLRDFILGKTAS